MANEKTETKKIETLTIVQNNRESIVQFQLTGKTSASGVDPGPLLQLVPGMNLLATEKWEKAKQNAVCMALLSEKIQPSKSPETNPERVGHCVLVEGIAVSKDNPLASLKDSDAVEFVEELFDIPMAKRFLNEETRGRVIAALKTQIDKIEKPAVRKSA